MAAKCEVCESLSATHVEAVTQQLQQAMRLDRALRFGRDIGAASSALSQAQKHALNACINFSGHFGEHANGGLLNEEKLRLSGCAVALVGMCGNAADSRGLSCVGKL